jgi:hypothetical protein
MQPIIVGDEAVGIGTGSRGGDVGTCDGAGLGCTLGTQEGRSVGLLLGTKLGNVLRLEESCGEGGGEGRVGRYVG